MNGLRQKLGRGWPRSWAEWVHLLASLTSLAAAIAAPLTLPNETWEAILVSWLCIAFTATLVLLYIQDVRYGRRSHYADASRTMRDAYGHLRDAAFIQFVSRNGEEEFRAKIKEAIAAFAAAFSSITGAPCRACIKQISAESVARAGNSDPRNIKVQDLCRSSGAPKVGVTDYVSDNTDFEELFLGSEEVFFCKDLRELSKRGQYKNSHWRADTIEKESYDYLSTIVWPIAKPLEDPGSAPKVEALRPDMDLIGFLCIDCIRPGVFDRHADVPLGGAFADTLYATLKTRSAARPAIELPERSEVDGTHNRR